MPDLDERPHEAVGRAPRQPDQGGIQQRHVLAREQADPAELVRLGDRDAGDDGRQDFRRLLLRTRQFSGEKTEAMPTASTPASRIFAAASFIAARSNGAIGRPSSSWPPRIMKVGPCTRPAQVGRPVDERRQGRRRRQADANRGDPGDMAALDDGVGEMRRADHHRVDPGRIDRTRRDETLQRRDDAVADLLGRGGLDRVQHALAVDQDGVGVGAADVDAEADHRTLSGKMDLKSMS